MKAFISGAILKEKTEAIEIKLKFLGYDIVRTAQKSDKKAIMIQHLIDSDAIITVCEPIGLDMEYYKIEQALSKIIGVIVLTEYDLNKMVADKVVNDKLNMCIPNDSQINQPL